MLLLCDKTPLSLRFYNNFQQVTLTHFIFRIKLFTVIAITYSYFGNKPFIIFSI